MTDRANCSLLLGPGEEHDWGPQGRQEVYLGPPSPPGTLLSDTACPLLVGSPRQHPKLTLVISHLLPTAAWPCLAGDPALIGQAPPHEGSALLNPWLSHGRAHKARWLQLSLVTTPLTSNGCPWPQAPHASRVLVLLRPLCLISQQSAQGN